ncbi:MAG: helix-hairpin-helix domain-containing protein [Rubrivivax sp.]
MFKTIIAALLALFTAAAFAAVDVNKATAAELDGVKGIGPGISTRIVEARKAGPFKDWQDFIDRVKGVGEGNAAKFSAEGLTVNGTSFKGAAPKAADAKPAKAEAKATEAKADAKADAKAAKAEAKAAKAEAAKAADDGASKAKKGKKEKKEKAEAAADAASKAKK